MHLINYVYSIGDVSLPVGCDVIRKPIKFCEVKSKKEKRKATVTKNELTRNQLKICQRNQLKYKYVLTDSWFSAKENMSFIRHDVNKHFVMAIKSNSTVAVSEKDKAQGRFTKIDSLGEVSSPGLLVKFISW